MKLPAFVARALRTKAAVEPMTAANNPGLIGSGWFSSIRESFSGAWQSGITIDGPRDILSFSGVFAPLTLIAADIAKAGVCLLEEVEDILKRVPKASPYWKVLKRPNHYQNWIQFIEQWVLSILMYGNTYVLKVREGRTMVMQLYILDPARVKVRVAVSGDVYYELSPDNLSGLPELVIVPAAEIIHDRMNCFWHPLVGVSPLYSAALSATLGRKIQNNSAKFFQNMSRPSGMLLAAGKISPEDQETIKAEWEKRFSGENQGRVAVLGSGMKYEAMAVPADQSQLLEQLQWAAKDCAAALHVPLFKVGGPIPVGSTIEALNLMYYSDCLQARIEAIESCLDDGLELPDGYCIEFDVDNLARMDTATQIKVLTDQVRGGIMAPNEGRRIRNLKPLKGGDSVYLQQQEFSLEALAKRDALPNPFVIDRPTTNPTPSADGPAPAADPKQGKSLTSAQAMTYARAKMLERIAA